MDKTTLNNDQKNTMQQAAQQTQKPTTAALNDLYKRTQHIQQQQ